MIQHCVVYGEVWLIQLNRLGADHQVSAVPHQHPIVYALLVLYLTLQTYLLASFFLKYNQYLNCN